MVLSPSKEPPSIHGTPSNTLTSPTSPAKNGQMSPPAFVQKERYHPSMANAKASEPLPTLIKLHDSMSAQPSPPASPLKANYHTKFHTAAAYTLLSSKVIHHPVWITPDNPAPNYSSSTHTLVPLLKPHTIPPPPNRPKTTTQTQLRSPPKPIT